MTDGVGTDTSTPTRFQVEVRGTVQGVGFRPFVYLLAGELGLDGWVRNVDGRVEIQVDGPRARLDEFVVRLRSDAPPVARVETIGVAHLPATPAPANSGFVILESASDTPGGQRWFPPDIAVCDNCAAEMLDPDDRRHRYPFINCTNCGPRATIIDDLPYDRRYTVMRAFPLCQACRREYEDPTDRRFHAEPIACPDCGPQLAYRPSADANIQFTAESALAAAIADLASGRIVAVKGLGGYQLACDATDEDAVRRLRERKHRWAKPLAVMTPDLAAAEDLAHVSDPELELVTSSARPIVLMEAKAGSHLAAAVCAGNPRVGLFLPYTPMHHLLVGGFGRPVVLTSGNLSDEPIAIDDSDALLRLGQIADSFLTNNRQIRARYDDSVTRVVRGSRAIIRRARGYAPTPMALPFPAREPLLATGAHLKHTFALALGDRAWIGPHTGDLEDAATHDAFTWNLNHLARLQALEPVVVAHDLHPGYLSTQYAVANFSQEQRIGIQHHHAHVAACAAEHGLRDEVIGVAFDGIGLGDDATLWGGEILIADLLDYSRFARFGLAPMPGGDAAVRKPYRMALGYLFGAEGPNAGEAGLSAQVRDQASPFLDGLDPREVEIVRTQVARGLNAPLTSSAGRLFDAASSLLGLCDVAAFEAQAAIELETAADQRESGELPWELRRCDGLWVYDPRPTLAALITGRADSINIGALAARFHNTVIAVTTALCLEARKERGLNTVCLSGGVLQNQWLAARLPASLEGEGFEVYMGEEIPVNDGGISYGQAAIAAARLQGR
ncbi:MAG: carbamoyltransferase HypF [Candidatus Nanopelagicales bacterium]|nr:carbamoyltransferase HypF [Candidatus Nanopelagicales bacterium]